MFRFGKASWRKGCCDSCSMHIYEGNGPVASVPSQMRRCNTRMFNAVRVFLEGKVSSVREQRKRRVDVLQRRTARAERQVAKAEEQGWWQQVHQKRRRLANLKFRLAGLEADIAAGRVRLCFGSKKLWRKQHQLEANDYASHEEWLQDWRDARSKVVRQ